VRLRTRYYERPAASIAAGGHEPLANIASFTPVLVRGEPSRVETCSSLKGITTSFWLTPRNLPTLMIAAAVAIDDKIGDIANLILGRIINSRLIDIRGEPLARRK
jgi:hypothetical protein